MFDIDWNFEPNLKLSLMIVGRIDDRFDGEYVQTRSKTQTQVTLNWLKQFYKVKILNFLLFGIGVCASQ